MVSTIFKQMVRSIVTKIIQNDMISTSCFILGMVWSQMIFDEAAQQTTRGQEPGF